MGVGIDFDGTDGGHSCAVRLGDFSTNYLELLIQHFEMFCEVDSGYRHIGER